MVQGRSIFVWFDSEEVDVPVFMGTLTASHVRGREIFSFEFDAGWLQRNRFRNFDPDLQFFSGRQFPSEDKPNFGIFLDSSPDRWGRVLMDRRETLLAREEKRCARSLYESDYLLGVFDFCRMGALRFKLDNDGEFLDNNPTVSTPPWTSLGELENASLNLEEDVDVIHSKWIRMLFAPGSSLGGARPKANALDKDGNLWIAKFPSRKDRRDIGAWEAVSMELARSAGISVSDWTLRRYNSDYHTFLTKRFDRTESGKRRCFTSAMTLLGYSDGEEGASYLELAEWIERNCMDVRKNLVELFRRIAFNIAISNCDDHLRNHGFIYSQKGWTLSPAYDMNPDPLGDSLKLCIDQNDNSLDFGTLLGIAPYLGLGRSEAECVVADVRKSVSRWRSVASRVGISKHEQELMSPAFSDK